MGGGIGVVISLILKGWGLPGRFFLRFLDTGVQPTIKKLTQWDIMMSKK